MENVKEVLKLTLESKGGQSSVGELTVILDAPAVAREILPNRTNSAPSECSFTTIYHYMVPH